MRRFLFPALLLTLLSFGAGPIAPGLSAAEEKAAPAVGKSAPTFTLSDVEKKKRTLAEFKGRRVALFFFCGCSWCADIAREWAALQRNGALAEQRGGKGRYAPEPPATVIVYSELNAATCRELSRIYGLDLARTVLLPDLEMRVTQSLYRAEPCPRVFVLDAKGVLRYTNDHSDDTPRKAPALAIVSRALEALRASAPSPKKKSPRDARRR